jgi:phenylalanine-4-hydroxylase
VGHGTSSHLDGFGSPIGKLKGINLAIEDMSPRDLRAYDIFEGEKVSLEFEGNISVSGEIITGSRNLKGEIIIVSFKNCTVKHNNEILFQPEWGVYDMAIGKKIVSAFSGPADANSFDNLTHIPSSKTIKSLKSEKTKKLEDFYQTVRDCRDKKNKTDLDILFNKIVQEYPSDWLLPIEILELVHIENEPLSTRIIAHLEQLKNMRHEVKKLIDNGLELIFGNTILAK